MQAASLLQMIAILRFMSERMVDSELEAIIIIGAKMAKNIGDSLVYGERNE
jgi:hypothetical protein